ncbi:MAG: Coenzyme F420 hydrogenase/dehydrogenase, beta subunit C-terminal domain [Oscillospiraceae bacterium]|nr:Coenzyme F420 hydrogenase/dehydrogenase, beta subunit C-terminal domain [Oscillospiraceae bacterium]
MSEVILAPQNMCTACGACVAACTKECISMESDALGCGYPVIDERKCIECGACRKACPVLTPQQAFPQGKVYAAWNADEQLRAQAASGGVATAIYQYALCQGMNCFGVACLADGKTSFIPIKSLDDIRKCRNSKYVYTDISPILKEIKQLVKSGETVVLPALPCQIGAVLAYMGGKRDNLILIDIVCHGVCPPEYLQQHITAITEKKNKRAETVYFRDPQFGTNQFVFSLHEKDRCFYHAPVHADDVYQLGYHKALTYRENCYHCNYAHAERLGDLTIADFGGLGRLQPFTEKRESVSCVIVSSPAGEALLNALKEHGFLTCRERPVQEAFSYEKQLKHASVPHERRESFLQLYRQSGQYEMAAKGALRKDISKNRIRRLLCIDQIRKGLSKWTPKKLKTAIRKVIKP